MKATTTKASNMHAKQSGFTLIEMLVSVALFSIVMLISVAAILSIIGGNRKAQAINSVSNNLNFAIESMIRDIKTGYNYSCASFGTFTANTNGSYPCTSTVPVGTVAAPFTFFSTLSIANTIQPVEYTFMSVDGVGTIMKKYTPLGLTDATSIPLTSPEVNITKFEMYVKNPRPSDVPKAQPSVFLIIEGEAKGQDNAVSKFSVQTYISQRLLNL